VRDDLHSGPAPVTRDEESPEERVRGEEVPGLILAVERDEPTALPIRLAEPLVLGREGPGALLLEDERVSRRHARLEWSGGELRVIDLGSRNGTWVDGERLIPHQPRTFSGARALRAGRNLLLPSADVRPLEACGVVELHGSVFGPRVRAAWSEIGRAARGGDRLLLGGESGTGKELAAREFHARGPRPDAPFVAVNCAAIPQGLAERLLFGARRGAYSGASADAPGHVQAARGGTLFLDEIGDLELPVQAKLLRALEAHEVTPLGAARPERVEFRLCAATHRDLRADVAAGTFREDLYHRLAQARVRLPPLRERPEDIPALIRLELRPAAGGLRAPAAFVEACVLRPWPGNVRELRAAVGAAARLALEESRPVLDARDLPEDAGRPLLARPEPDPSSTPTPRTPPPDRGAIAQALQRARGNVSATARALGVHRTQLRRFLARYELDPRQAGAAGEGEP